MRLRDDRARSLGGTIRLRSRFPPLGFKLAAAAFFGRVERTEEIIRGDFNPLARPDVDDILLMFDGDMSRSFPMLDRACANAHVSRHWPNAAEFRDYIF